VLDLDGSVAAQGEVMRRYTPLVAPVHGHAPTLRLTCSLGRFRRFMEDVRGLLPDPTDAPAVVLVGSGDFHHVAHGLVQRIGVPVNLVVLDAHADWTRGNFLLHCGTWLNHASRLPHVARVFHVGGVFDFENRYQRFAPWRLIESGKIRVFPGTRRLERRQWARIPTTPLRADPDTPATREQIESVFAPHRDELASRPLYVTIDKDVLRLEHAVVNWHSGALSLAELSDVLRVLLDLSGGRLAGADVVGDWSPVVVEGLARRLSHWIEHPRVDVSPAEAVRCNEETNLALLDVLGAVPSGHGGSATQ
jgi:arginase family enzyme